MKTSILLLLILSISLYSQVTEEWVNRYSGPEINGAAVPYAMTIDNLGNIYVAGSAVVPGVNGSDYVTIKYAGNGNIIWIKTYNGNGSSIPNDIPASIVVDNDGNVYVAGKSVGVGTGFDFVTIKYNSAGEEIWIERYSAGLFDDEPSSIALDMLGNVFVTGRTKATFSSTYIYTTLKYSTDGDQLWISNYDGPGNGNDWAKSIQVDNVGNSYVTGQVLGQNGNSDYATIKYSPGGSELWVKIYNGPENFHDIAEDIELDEAGNVYVTGLSHTFYTTIKYNSDGDEMWVQRYGNGESVDWSKKIAVDNLSNVYITGESWAGSNTMYNYATTKYNSSGNTQWTSIYDGPVNSNDRASYLEVDNSGNVYVTGWSDSQGGVLPNLDFATVKYNFNGIEQWVMRYNGTGDGPDMAISLAIDNDGNVFVTGSSKGEYLNQNLVTIKYTQGTTLTMDSPAGSQTLEVASTNGFSIGDNIVINPGGTTEETNTITGFGSILLQSPLQFDHFSGEQVVVVINTAVEEIFESLPYEYSLSQNYPNPFNPSTTISWQSPVGSHQTLKIYDLLGNEIATLVDEYLPTGTYKVIFDASGLSSGIYFYKLQAGSFVQTKKMLLLK